jgi:hypothetical protein
LTCNGSAANDIRTFSPPSTIGGYASADYTIGVTVNSAGGTDGNTIQNIQTAAPKYYQAQGRAVTTNDYEAIIHNKIGGVDSVSVWAGEDNVPKQPGSVFISIKPTATDVLTPKGKQDVIDALSDYNVVGIIPVIVDPSLIYITANATVNYNKDKVVSNTNITSVALNAITSYFDKINSTFDSNLLYSKLLATIDASSPDIINSNVEYTVSQNMILQNNTITVTVDYNNEITPGTILSASWAVPNGDSYLLKDNKTTSNMELWINGVFDSVVGSVNYLTGVVSITGIDSKVAFNQVSMSCELVEDDVLIDRNYIIQLKSAEVEANGV